MAVDTTFAPGSNYRKQGNKVDEVGGELNILSGGEIDIESGGAIKVAGVDVTPELTLINGVTATGSELNKNDISAQVETVTAAGAASVLVKNTLLDSTIATFALTLAAPDATMYGVVKTIEMTADNGDVTLTLTNVQGGSAATTATWASVNDCLVLIGGTSKWHVIGESGVTLS
jgi:hypothetical protein